MIVPILGSFYGLNLEAELNCHLVSRRRDRRRHEPSPRLHESDIAGTDSGGGGRVGAALITAAAAAADRPPADARPVRDRVGRRRLWLHHLLQLLVPALPAAAHEDDEAEEDDLDEHDHESPVAHLVSTHSLK